MYTHVCYREEIALYLFHLLESYGDIYSCMYTTQLPNDGLNLYNAFESKIEYGIDL